LGARFSSNVLILELQHFEARIASWALGFHGTGFNLLYKSGDNGHRGKISDTVNLFSSYLFLMHTDLQLSMDNKDQSEKFWDILKISFFKVGMNERCGSTCWSIWTSVFGTGISK
jgi:hypothetical protein